MVGLFEKILEEMAGIGNEVSKGLANTKEFEAEKKAIEDYNQSDKEYWEYKAANTENKNINLVRNGIAFGFLFLVILLVIKNIKTAKK